MCGVTLKVAFGKFLFCLILPFKTVVLGHSGPRCLVPTHTCKFNRGIQHTQVQLVNI